MIPILYDASESTFTSNGLGKLSDALSCMVTEERNGIFELDMRYPITGIHYSDIGLRKIILAKPNPTAQEQPFRIYRITKPINGIVEIFGEHISYDLSGIPIQPFTASDVVDAFVKLKQNAVVTCPFNFITEKTTVATMNVNAPCSLRSQLGGKAGSILDVYGGGEYEFDRFTVRLYQNRGQDNGVTIRYGKNLVDLTQEQNCANVYTGVYPFWIDSETGEVTQLDEKIVPVTGTFSFVRIFVLDLSSIWQEEPTREQILAYTENYIETSEIGIPKINLNVSFVQLEQTEEYKGMALLERVSLCDTVTIHFEKLGVNATAKAIKMVYDVLLDRIDSVEFGNSRTNLTDSIFEQEQAMNEAVSSADVAAMSKKITADILGANGGSVRILDNDGDGVLDTLYIADNENPALASKVWRFNYEGWGASNNGFDGPFVLGATLDSGLLADFITAGELNAGLIKAGIIQDKANKNYWNMNTGEFRLTGSTYVGSGTDTLNSMLDGLQDQIDGQIDNYFYNYTPTLNNLPASSWTTTADKNNHLGDLFYDISTGYGYRFVLDGSTYKWVQIADDAVVTALAKANEAQYTADNKRRIFTIQPTTPYDIGDIWFNQQEIYVCNHSRTQNESYLSGDWVKEDGYTGDGEAAYGKNYLKESYKEVNFLSGECISGNNTYSMDTKEVLAFFKSLVVKPGLIPRTGGNPDYSKTFCVSFDVKTDNEGPSTGQNKLAVEIKIGYYGKYEELDDELMPTGNTYDDFGALSTILYFPRSLSFTRVTEILNIEHMLDFNMLEVYYFTDFTIEMADFCYGKIVDIRNAKLEVGTECTPWCSIYSDDAYAYRQIYNRLDSVDVEYALGDSPTVAPETGWSTLSPQWTEGKYIWSRTVSITGAGVIQYTDPACIQGAKGEQGTSVTIDSIKYAVTLLPNAEPEESDWGDDVPATIGKGQWLWVRTTYSDNSSSTTKSYIGKDGIDGKSVYVKSAQKEGSVTTVILIDSDGNETEITVEDGTDGTNGIDGISGYVHLAWANSDDGTEDFSTTDSEGKSYLGVYTDDVEVDSQDPDDYSWSLIKGADGTSVSITSIKYATMNDPSTEPSSSDWKDNAPTSIPQGKWLWVRTTYSDTSTTTTKSYVGTDGNDGKSVYISSASKSGGVTTVILTDSDGNDTELSISDGEDGSTGIAGKNGYVHTAWANSADGITDFSTTVSANKTYLGVYTDNTELDSTTPSDYSWSLIKGAKGATGATGKGVTSIVEQYYLSTSNTDCVGGSWDTKQPEWTSGKYIWTRSYITWTTGNPTTTTPVLAKAINGANSTANTASQTANSANNTATTASKTANTASQNATNALSTAQAADAKANTAIGHLSQQGIFNLLTNNGAAQGIYLQEGLLYINAKYMVTGVLTDLEGKNSWNLQTGEFQVSSNTAIGSDGDTFESVLQKISDTEIISTVTSSSTYKYGLSESRNFALESDKESEISEAGTIVRDLSPDLYKASNNGERIRISFYFKRKDIVANSENKYFEARIMYKENGNYYSYGNTFKSTDSDFSPTDNDWVKIARTYDMTEYEPTEFIYFFWRYPSDVTGSIKVKDLKIEVSDDYTAWSPAIEDLTAVSNRLSAAELKITNTAIVSTVRSSEQYKYDLNASRNFALSSDKEVTFNEVGTAFQYLATDLFEASGHGARLRVSFDIKRTDVAPDSNDQYFEICFSYRDATGIHEWGHFLKSTDSDYASSDENWVRVTYNMDMDTSTITALEITNFFWLYPSDVSGTVQVRKLKIEVSDTFTSWCPAIEDVSDLETRMSSAELKITDSAITSVVRSAGFVSGKEEIVSTINQTSSSVKIDAANIAIGAFTYGNADKNGNLPGSLYTGGQINTDSTTSTGISASDYWWAFWAGSGKFRVQQDGCLVAGNGNFIANTDGSISARSAQISGEVTAGSWKLANGGLSYNTGDITNFAVKFTDSQALVMAYTRDIAYGAQDNHNTLIYGHRIGFYPSYGSNNDLAIYGIPNDGSGYTHGSFYPYENNHGNIGTPNSRWNAIRYGSGGCSGTSSRTRKTNIVSLPEMGDILDQLEPVEFDFIENGEHSVGLILEDVYPILPTICDVEDDNFMYGGIFYDKLSPILLKEIQSLRKRVKNLEEKTA